MTEIITNNTETITNMLKDIMTSKFSEVTPMVTKHPDKVENQIRLRISNRNSTAISTHKCPQTERQ